MRSLFDWRRRAPDPVAPDGPTVADQQVARARVERNIAEREAASRRITGRGGWRDAYDRGRRDERARRGGFSLISAVVLMAAVVGGGAIFLAAREGSFTAGGEVVDHQLSTAASKASTPLRGAADRAGDALKNAGQNLKNKAGSSDADPSQQQASN